MAKRISIRGGIKGGHWKHALKVIHHHGTVLMPTLFSVERGRLKGAQYVVASAHEEKLVRFGYEEPHLLIANPPALAGLDVRLSPELTRLLQTFMPGGMTAIVSTRDGPVSILMPSSEVAVNLLLRHHGPVFFQEVLDVDSIEDLKTDYGDIADLWFDVGDTSLQPSTLIDLTRPVPVVLRKGSVQIMDIEEVLGSQVKLGPGVVFTVLFLCTGNTCRSALAKAILESRLKGRRVLVYSAGTHDFGRLPASEGARIVAQEYGADLSGHYSVPLNRYLIESSDLILCMELRHRRRVLELCPEAASRTFLLTKYGGGTGFEEVFDPVGAPVEVFRKVGEVISNCLDSVVADIDFRMTPETRVGVEKESA